MNIFWTRFCHHFVLKRGPRGPGGLQTGTQGSPKRYSGNTCRLNIFLEAFWTSFLLQMGRRAPRRWLFVKTIKQVFCLVFRVRTRKQFSVFCDVKLSTSLHGKNCWFIMFFCCFTKPIARSGVQLLHEICKQLQPLVNHPPLHIEPHKNIYTYIHIDIYIYRGGWTQA